MATGLTLSETAVVRTAVSDVFGSRARVWLFGSRAAGSTRGDIDLCVEIADRPENLLLARIDLRRRLEASLRQKVDVVAHVVGEPEPAIVRIAHETGELL